MQTHEIEQTLAGGHPIRGVLLRSGGWKGGYEIETIVKPHPHLPDMWVVSTSVPQSRKRHVTHVPSEHILAITLEP
jgi:hypothetical protein